jgi:hypothetical protein
VTESESNELKKRYGAKRELSRQFRKASAVRAAPLSALKSYHATRGGMWPVYSLPLLSPTFLVAGGVVGGVWRGPTSGEETSCG